MNVVFHYPAGVGLSRRLAALDGLSVSVCPEDDVDLFDELLKNADVLWHVLKPVTARHIEGAPRLRLIQKIGVGVNTIDLEAARARSIAVCNLPGTNSRATAEMTIALMLAALRRLPTFDRAMRRGDGWGLVGALQDELGELGGKVVGIVGYGAVARALVPILQGFGARVLYTSRSTHSDAAAEWRPLQDLLAESDIVSLHVPLTNQTDRLLDEEAIGRMKPGAILINTARGPLVDAVALVSALRSGHIAAAGLDVYAEEPVPADSPLLDLDNVVLTPHVAWLTPETFDRSFAVAVQNCRRLAGNEPLLHRVV
jgi:phosphoglycerate dehydrogenase-like enzyme